jgi:hypothetical protein
MERDLLIKLFPVKPFCKPGQTMVYGVAKREKIHVTCDVVANPSEGLYFNWVFNSSSERLDLQENLIQSQGSRSIAEHTPQVHLSFFAYMTQWYDKLKSNFAEVI